MINKRFGTRAASVLAVLSAWATALFFAAPAMAGMGQPSPRQMGLQQPATPIATEIHHFYDLVNIIIIAIAVFVPAARVHGLVGRTQQGKLANSGQVTGEPAFRADRGQVR